MTKKKIRRAPTVASTFDQARDELFSHILRCGVIEALPEHQKEWFDDTMQYLTERYEDLTEVELNSLRELAWMSSAASSLTWATSPLASDWPLSRIAPEIK